MNIILAILEYIKKFIQSGRSFWSFSGVQFVRWKIYEPITVFLYKRKLIRTTPLSLVSIAEILKDVDYTADLEWFDKLIEQDDAKRAALAPTDQKNL